VRRRRVLTVVDTLGGGEAFAYTPRDTWPTRHARVDTLPRRCDSAADGEASPSVPGSPLPFDPKGLGGSSDPVERYLSGVAIYGTPDQVVDELQRLREEMFLDYLLCAPLSHESFLLLTDRVIPKLG